MKRANDRQPKLDHLQVRSLDSIIPAPDNDDVYRPIAYDDPEIRELAKSIKIRGVLEPLLISLDGFLISGHRRRIASLMTGLKEVPVQIHPISRKEDPNGFLKLLVEANSHRIKSATELLHESAIKIDPKTAHDQIVNDRIEKQNRNRAKLSVIAPASSGGSVHSSYAETKKTKAPSVDYGRVVELYRKHGGYEALLKFCGTTPELMATKTLVWLNDLYRALDIICPGGFKEDTTVAPLVLWRPLLAANFSDISARCCFLSPNPFKSDSRTTL